MIPNYREFIWKDDRLLYCNRQTGAKIVPDAEWPNMFRVEYPSGVLSDMVNLTRAKDAAVVLVARDFRISSNQAAQPRVVP